MNIFTARLECETKQILNRTGIRHGARLEEKYVFRGRMRGKKKEQIGWWERGKEDGEREGEGERGCRKRGDGERGQKDTMTSDWTTRGSSNRIYCGSKPIQVV